MYFIHFYYKIVKCKWLTKSIFSFLACRVMKDVSIAWSGAEMESRLMAWCYVMLRQTTPHPTPKASDILWTGNDMWFLLIGPLPMYISNRFKNVPSLSLLASGSDDHHAIIWDPFQRKLMHRVNTGHNGNIFSVKVWTKYCFLLYCNFLLETYETGR